MPSSRFQERAKPLLNLIAHRSGPTFGNLVEITPDEDYEAASLQSPHEVVNVIEGLQRIDYIEIIEAGAEPGLPVDLFAKWSVKLTPQGYDSIGLSD